MLLLQTKKVLLTLLLPALFIFSCKKKQEPPTPPDKPYVTDVYSVGFKVINSQRVAVYWKNGIQVNINSDVNSSFNGIAVVDTDVYLAGRSAAGATFWKNGKPFYMAADLSELYAIAVSGNEVCVAGRVWQQNEQYGRAAYWINGVETDLTDGSAPAAINSIVISGTDVYLAGYYNQGQNANTWGEPVAACWKNQTLLPLDSAAASAPTGATATGVAVNGSDVYVTGYIGFTAALWKNGALQTLKHNSGSPAYSFGFSVALNGGDVFVSGSDVNEAAFWQNGAVNNLITGAPVQSGAQSLYFQNGDMYMAGYIGLNGQPVYWKNKVMYPLQNNGEFYNVNGIAVSRHQ